MSIGFVRAVCTVAILLSGSALVGCGGGGGSTSGVSALPALGAGGGSAVSVAVPTPAPAPSSAPTSTVGEQATSSDAFVDSIGVNTQFNWGAAHDNYLAARSALTRLGIRHIRDGLTASPLPGYFEHLNDLAAAGIHSTLTSALSDDVTQDAAVVDRIGGALEAIEAPNEVNSGTNWAPGLAAFQKALYAAVKSNPSAARLPVIGPALARDSGAYAVLGDLSASLDEGNMHDYSAGNAPGLGNIGLAMVASAHVSAGKPIVATETGYCTSTAFMGVPAVVMTRYVPRMFLEHFNAGVARTFEYQLLDDGFDGTNLWSQCGLLAHDFTPKPGYTALMNLIALLTDRGGTVAASRLDYTLAGTNATIHHTLLHKSDGSLFLAVWIEASDFDQTRHAVLTVAPQTLGFHVGTPVASLTAYSFDDTGALTPTMLGTHVTDAQISVSDRVTVLKIVP